MRKNLQFFFIKPEKFELRLAVFNFSNVLSLNHGYGNRHGYGHKIISDKNDLKFSPKIGVS